MKLWVRSKNWVFKTKRLVFGILSLRCDTLVYTVKYLFNDLNKYVLQFFMLYLFNSVMCYFACLKQLIGLIKSLTASS